MRGTLTAWGRGVACLALVGCGRLGFDPLGDAGADARESGGVEVRFVPANQASRVTFHGVDGEVIAAVDPDALGVARAAVPAGSAVTWVGDTGVYPRVQTVLGIVDGDVYLIDRTPNAYNTTVSLPALAVNERVVMRQTCWRYGWGPVSDNMPPGLFDICPDGEVPTVVVCLLVDSSLDRCALPLASNDPIVLDAAAFTPTTPRTLQLRNVPAGAQVAVEVITQINDQVAVLPAQGMPPPQSGDVTVPFNELGTSPAERLRVTVRRNGDDIVEQVVTVPGTTSELDIATAVLPDLASPPVLDLAGQQLTWTGSTSAASVARVIANNGLPVLDDNYFEWQLLTPFTGTTVPLPRLPPNLGLQGDPSTLSELELIDAPGGVAAFTRGALWPTSLHQPIDDARRLIIDSN